MNSHDDAVPQTHSIDNENPAARKEKKTHQIQTHPLGTPRDLPSAADTSDPSERWRWQPENRELCTASRSTNMIGNQPHKPVRLHRLFAGNVSFFSILSFSLSHSLSFSFSISAFVEACVAVDAIPESSMYLCGCPSIHSSQNHSSRKFSTLFSHSFPQPESLNESHVWQPSYAESPMLNA